MKKMNDAYVESVIKKAIGGFLTTGQAAASLMVTKQYVNKLKKEYRSRGSKAFKHGNAGKSRPWKTDESVEKEILRLYDGPVTDKIEITNWDEIKITKIGESYFI